MKFKTLCKMRKDALIYDGYSGETLTVEDAISTIEDRWSDYDGELYPFENLNEHGTPDLYQDLTLKFANIYSSEFIPLQNFSSGGMN